MVWVQWGGEVQKTRQRFLAIVFVRPILMFACHGRTADGRGPHFGPFKKVGLELGKKRKEWERRIYMMDLMGRESERDGKRKKEICLWENDKLMISTAPILVLCTIVFFFIPINK